MEGVWFGINCASKHAIRKAIGLCTTHTDKIVLVYPNAGHPTAESYTSTWRDDEDVCVFVHDICALLPNLTYVG